MTSDELKEKFGIDEQEAIQRLLDDKDFYLSLLTQFPKSNSFADMKRDFLNEDYPSLFLSSHEMKGTAGNLSFFKLYASVSILCDMVRKEPFSPKEDIKKEFKIVEDDYLLALKGIEVILKENKSK